jgi:hypothetical protein
MNSSDLGTTIMVCVIAVCITVYNIVVVWRNK